MTRGELLVDKKLSKRSLLVCVEKMRTCTQKGRYVFRRWEAVSGRVAMFSEDGKLYPVGSLCEQRMGSCIW